MPPHQHSPSPVLRVGDQVTCRFASPNWLRAGQTYRVEEVVSDEDDPDRCQLVGLNIAPGHLWGAWRFVKA